MTAIPIASALGTPRTLQLGLVGAGISRSRTPAMQEAEGAAHGLRTVYRLFDTADMAEAPPLGALIEAMQLCGYAGCNVTYPYKIAVCDHLDSLSPEAEALGAVNTVSFEGGRRTGYNTDLGGFRDSFERDLADVPRRHVLLIGAGGAGLAVAFALLECGVETLSILDLDRDRAEGLAAASARIGARDRVRVASSIEGRFDGIVNATPLGTTRFPGLPYPIERLAPSTFVVDVNYVPLETALVLGARQRGCRAIGGAGMAVGQAARAFFHFTGLQADRTRMMETFLALGG